jgi:hypothetical protein
MQEESQEIDCLRVEPYLVDGMWGKCSKFLENPDIGDIEFSTTEELKEECKNGHAQLWAIAKGEEVIGAFCTNFGEATSSVNVCNIYYLSGEGAKVWSKIIDKKVSDFAKENNCSYYMCVARKGFARLVPQLKEAGTLFVRDLCKEDV